LEDNYKLLDSEQDWFIFDYYNDNTIDITNLKLEIIKKQYNKDKLDILNSSIDSIIKNNIKNYKKFKISELFMVNKKPIVEYKNLNNIVPVISAKKINDGISKYENAQKNTFTGNKIVLITGGNGGAGLAFYQENDFSITSATIVLTPKYNIKLNKYIGIYIQYKLSNYKKKYSRGFGWSIERINNDIISLPITENNEIDYKYIENLF